MADFDTRKANIQLDEPKHFPCFANNDAGVAYVQQESRTRVLMPPRLRRKGVSFLKEYKKQESIQNFLDGSVAIYPSNFLIRLRNTPGNHTVAHFATRSANIWHDISYRFPGSAHYDSCVVHVYPERR